MSTSGNSVGRLAVVSGGGGGFSAHVQERLGWYVYLLRNPLDGTVFYVGKGKGNRCFAHARDAAALLDEEKPKPDLIRRIHAVGHPVAVEILRHAISTDKAAYEVEAAVLYAYRAVGLPLANVAGGHHVALRGWATAEVVASLYEAPPHRSSPNRRSSSSSPSSGIRR